MRRIGSMSSRPTEPASTRSRLFKAGRRLIEILPVIIALTALFSYRAIDGLTDQVLATPIGQVVQAVPPWVNVLMLLTAFTGLAGMFLLIMVFARPASVAGRAAVTPGPASAESEVAGQHAAQGGEAVETDRSAGRDEQLR